MVEGGGGGDAPLSDNFLRALKSKEDAEIRNCQCEISYKICQVQLDNKFKDCSNSGIPIAIQLSSSFYELVFCKNQKAHLTFCVFKKNVIFDIMH